MRRREFLSALAGLGIAQRGFAAATQSPSTLLRSPYLQNMQDRSTSILWASPQFGEAAVEYSSDGLTGYLIPSSPRDFPAAETGMSSFTQYQADLASLVPNTNYVYRVIMDGQEAARGSFRTAGPGPLKFIAIGDSGQGTDMQHLMAQQIAKERPNFLMHAGDIAYFDGTQAEFQQNYFDIYRDVMSRIPFFPTPGNHDYATESAKPYLSMHSLPVSNVTEADRGRYYSFDWGNVHVVCLDSNISLHNSVYGDGAMLQWLEEDLRSTHQFWRIAMFHHPPYAGGPNQGDPETHLVRTHLVPILEKNGVQLVISGHEHSYQRTESIRDGSIVGRDSGTSYIISGGGGSALYPTFSHPLHAISRSDHHYLTVEVDGMRMSVSAIALNGSVLDQFTLSPRPSLTDDVRVKNAYSQL